MPTAEFAHHLSNLVYVVAVVAFLTGIIGLLTLTEPRRRYIAQLPRLTQWMIWPFHGKR